MADNIPQFGNIGSSPFPIAAIADMIQRKGQLDVQNNERSQELLNQSLQAISAVGQSLVDKRLKVAQALALGQQFSIPPEQARNMTPEQILGAAAVNKGQIDMNLLLSGLRLMHGGGVPGATSPVEPASAMSPSQSTGNNGAILTGGVPLPSPVSTLQPSVSTGTVPTPSSPPLARPKMVNAATANMAMKMVEASKPENVYQYTPGKGLEPVGTKRKGDQIITTQPQGSQTTEKTVDKIVSRFNNDPQVRRQMQSLDGADAVRGLAISGNPIAAAAIPTYMARASGEVGNLSEPDKAPFGGTRAILSRMEAALTQLSKGTLTQTNRDFLLELADIMEKSANKNLDRHARINAKQYAHAHASSPQDIFQSLRPDSQFEEPKSFDINPSTATYTDAAKEAEYQAWKANKLRK